MANADSPDELRSEILLALQTISLEHLFDYLELRHSSEGDNEDPLFDLQNSGPVTQDLSSQPNPSM